MVIVIICTKEMTCRRREVSLQSISPWRKVKEGKKQEKIRKTEESGVCVGGRETRWYTGTNVRKWEKNL